MEYPLFINGEQRGTLRAQQEGLYTVFEAELSGLPEGMYRIWLHGGEEQAYLGLMQPWSGGMYLRRKLSRSELASLPEVIEYASDQNEMSLHNTKGRREPETEPASCPYPAPVPEEGELLWFRREDGSLVAHDGISSLVALPSSLRNSIPGAVVRIIEDREYIVFRY